MRWYHRRVDPRTGERYYEHRAIAEWKIGRPLQPDEVVHHINNDPQDNHPDNLAVLPSQSAHMRLHHYQRREAAGVQHLFPIEVFLREAQRLSYEQPAEAVRGSAAPGGHSLLHASVAYGD